MTEGFRRNIRELAIGEKVRLIRENKGISTVELAQKTGLSNGLVSQIENEQVSPPISTLLKIANGLSTDISFFFQEKVGNEKVVAVHKNERMISPRKEVKGKAHLGYTYEALAYKKAFKHMEPFLVTFDVKDKEDIIMFSHEGEEFAFVLEGSLEFTTEQQTIVLEEGDSLYFESDQLHGFRGIGENPSKALVIVYHQ